MKRFIKLLIIIFVIGIPGFFIWEVFFNAPKFISPVPEVTASKKSLPTVTGVPVSMGLKAVVEEELLGTTGTYGIAIKNLKTGEAYFSREHRIFAPASLYKLWIMAIIFDYIQNGQLKEEDVLSKNIPSLNSEFNISSEYAELTSGTISLSIKDALEQMITISHNYAALLLTSEIKLSNVTNFLKQNDFNESSIGEPPKTTAYDIALFFEKLYKREFANIENTPKMIDLLTRQTRNNKLPKYLPREISVAHKTGEIDFLSHDAGIVFSKTGDYIIVVLSQTDSPKDAEERIAKISQAVYKYFSSK